MWSESETFLICQAFNYFSIKHYGVIDEKFKNDFSKFTKENYLEFFNNVELLTDSSILNLVKENKNLIVSLMKKEVEKNAV